MNHELINLVITLTIIFLLIIFLLIFRYFKYRKEAGEKRDINETLRVLKKMRRLNTIAHVLLFNLGLLIIIVGSLLILFIQCFGWLMSREWYSCNILYLPVPLLSFIIGIAVIVISIHIKNTDLDSIIIEKEKRIKNPVSAED